MNDNKTAKNIKFQKLWPKLVDLGTPVLQILVLFIFPFIIIKISEYSAFVGKCPSQYGKIIISLLITGLLSNFISFLRPAIKREVSIVSRVFSIFGILFIGIVSVLTWNGFWDNTLVRSLEFWVLIFAIISAIVSYASIRKKENKIYFRHTLFYVDIPLLTGCLIIILFKQFYFNESSEAFIEFFLQTMPSNKANTPDSLNQNEMVQNLLRENFWLGFSTGVVTIQLITTQLVSSVIGLEERYKSKTT